MVDEFRMPMMTMPLVIGCSPDSQGLAFSVLRPGLHRLRCLGPVYVEVA